MTKRPRETCLVPSTTPTSATGIPSPVSCETSNEVTEAHPSLASEVESPVTPLRGAAEERGSEDSPKPKTMSRGLSAYMATSLLQRVIWRRALLMADRFRVIRTIDVAVCCFPERPFKAALTAAQRAVRGMVKADLLRRYRTDRFQTVYGLTQRGADWLDEAGHDASSSVRRVSDMTNPEHRLWAQFLVLASEARGLRALTEQELLQHLNQGNPPDKPLMQGMLGVTWNRGQKSVLQQLRPDAVAWESDGLTWFEVDRSKRGADREAALAALAGSVGRTLKDGSVLRRVVVFSKTERIEKRALAVLQGLARVHNGQVLTTDRCHYREGEPGTYEVWSAVETKLRDGRTRLTDVLAGHVIVQRLPAWLPKVRIDSSNRHSTAGWLSENFLPYRRPASVAKWSQCHSPLAQLDHPRGI